MKSAGQLQAHLTIKNSTSQKRDIDVSKPRNVACMEDGEQGADPLDHWSGIYKQDETKTGTIRVKGDGECAGVQSTVEYQIYDATTPEPEHIGDLLITELASTDADVDHKWDAKGTVKAIDAHVNGEDIDVNVNDVKA